MGVLYRNKIWWHLQFYKSNKKGTLYSRLHFRFGFASGESCFVHKLNLGFQLLSSVFTSCIILNANSVSIHRQLHNLIWSLHIPECTNKVASYCFRIQSRYQDYTYVSYSKCKTRYFSYYGRWDNNVGVGVLELDLFSSSLL